MSNLTYAEFEADARSQGFDEVLVREWPPLATLDNHTHPFALKALVTRGEFWLSVGEATRHLQAGDRFDLDREVVHGERYGAEGATFWVARRHESVATAT